MTGSTILWLVNSKGEYVASTSSGWWLFDGTTYVSLNDPGTATLRIVGLNDSGEVVGEYLDAKNDTHSFLFHNGAFTEIETGHTDVFVQGVTDGGDVYGYYQDIQGGTVSAVGFLGVPEASTPEPGTAGALLIGLLLLAAGQLGRLKCYRPGSARTSAS